MHKSMALTNMAEQRPWSVTSVTTVSASIVATILAQHL